MSDLIIKINKKTRKVILKNSYIGNDHENLQENLVFQFDEFVDGQARLEYEINEVKNYIILQKENETYTIPVQNVITIYQEQTKGKINFQLVVTEGTEEENIPVFKSNIFFLICRPSINAVTEAPEGYDLWIEQANTKLNAMDEALEEVENLNISAERVQDGVEVSITDKEGIITITKINDGQDGQDGKDGKDGKDGDDYVITQQDYQNIANIVEQQVDIPTALSQLTDDSTHRTVTDTEKGTWNNKAEVSDIPDVSNFITKNVNNLTNYTLKTNTGSLIDLEINQTTYVVTLSLKDQDGNVISTDTIDLPLENVVVSGSYDSTNQKIVLTLQSGDTVDIPVGALVSGLQSEITSQNKLASDLIDDSNSGNKFVTTSEKQAWNNKLDTDDLTDYVKNTDYATSNVGGVVKANSIYGLSVSVSGLLIGSSKNATQYNDAGTALIVSKGTLENVIIGKGLVSDTDYAASSKGGVIKTGSNYGTSITTNGQLCASNRTYEQYQTDSNQALIGKTTLENVITGKQLTNKTYVDGLVGNIDTVLETLTVGGGVS